MRTSANAAGARIVEGVASVSVGGTQANKASEEVFANLMQSEEAQSNDQCREYKGLGWPRGSGGVQ